MDDFCAELAVSPSTAYKWSAAGPSSGRFPRFRKLPNGSIRIRRDWFEEWLDGLGPTACWLARRSGRSLAACHHPGLEDLPAPALRFRLERQDR